MNCEQAQQRMVDFLYGELSPEERRAFERHLQECPEHAREAEKLRGVLELVRGQKPEELPQELGQRILRSARASFEQQARPRRSPWARILSSPLTAAAILAGVILTVGLAINRFTSQTEEQQASRLAPAETPVAPAMAPAPAAAPDESTRAEPIEESEPKGSPESGMLAGAAKQEQKEMPIASSAADDKADRLQAQAKPKRARKRPARIKRRQAPKAGEKKKARHRAKSMSRGIGGAAPSDLGEFRPAEAPAEEGRPAEALAKEGDLSGRASGEIEQVETQRFAAPPPPQPMTEANKPQAAQPSKELENLAEAPEATAADQELPRKAPMAAKPAPRKDARAEAKQDLYRQAESNLSANNYPAALAGFRRFLSSYPNDPRAATCRFQIARTLFLMGRCPEAIRAARQAVQAAPRNKLAPTALLDQASCHVRLNQFQKARQVYRQIERDYPAYAGEARREAARIPE